MDIVLTVEGMHCGGCAASVKQALKAAGAGDGVAVDLATGRVTIAGAPADADRARFVTAVEDAGYDAAIAA